MGYILTVTLNTAIDTTLILPTELRIGETQRVNEVLKLPGGKGLGYLLITMPSSYSTLAAPMFPHFWIPAVSLYVLAALPGPY